MRHYLGSAWTAVKVATFAATAALLAGCMIVSEAELIADSEGDKILPATAYLTGYDEDGANTWKVSDDPAQVITLSGGTYSTADGSLNARFVPLESVPGKYLLALVSADGGSIYGVASFRNDILVAEVILADPEPLKTIQTAGVPELSGVTSEEGGLKITKRDELDALVQLYLDDKLIFAGLVMYVSDDPKATPPARIVNENGEYREE